MWSAVVLRWKPFYHTVDLHAFQVLPFSMFKRMYKFGAQKSYLEAQRSEKIDLDRADYKGWLLAFRQLCIKHVQEQGLLNDVKAVYCVYTNFTGLTFPLDSIEPISDRIG
ncbi:hypothetical protein GDO78_001163 [Eleutherodactylus coqui]|uniref:Uncharacterized protein n=1 Tax=Eleutherodactylus coqui TaxID=57060 RepID=A0A8J6FT93_ELECQ|nr:hypothetical protein GDO78_001163 [Eleutherodactylus coqui]